MRDTKLILVEGMPGTGKSTVAQAIHLQLSAAGQPSYWCHEERASHPIRLFYDRDRHRRWSDYHNEAVLRWRSFALELHSRGQIAVLDASLLQNHVRSMLLFDCAWDPILDLVRDIENLLLPLRPVWIYLKPHDVERNFRDVVEVRGQRLLDLWIEAQERFPYAATHRAAGYPGFIAFWKEFDELADRIFDRLAIAKLRQNVSGDDWDARIGRILEFLDLPLPADSLPSPALQRFAGTYVPVNDRTATGFVLQARDRFLILSCDEPTMDVERGPIGCYRKVRLIPNAENHFHVAGWPHQVEFVEDRASKSISMRLRVADDGWAPSSEAFVRQ